MGWHPLARIVELPFAMFSRVDSRLAPMRGYCDEMNRCARAFGLPRQWIVCPLCGEQSWVFPPHLLSPCPFVVESAELIGHKLDAERMMAVRTGVNIEEMTKTMRKALGLEDEDENET